MSIHLPIQAMRSTAAELNDYWESRPCDSDGVADCFRCRTVFLSRSVLRLLDELPEEAYRGVETEISIVRSRTNTRQFCARCRSIDRVGFLAPKELWCLVAGPHWEHDILCLRCFAEIGDEKGVRWDVPGLEFYPVSYATLQANRDHTKGTP